MTNNPAMSWCPYCLQTKPTVTSATSSPRDSVEDVLDAEIENTEKLISRLLRERTRLYRKRNEIRSPICSLPTEILSLIFKFACQPLDFLEMYDWNPLRAWVASPDIIRVLTEVSARWHNIVSSTPSLWTTFVADDRDMNTMKTVISRSGNLPVAVSLDFPFPVGSVSHRSHTTIIAPVLQEIASRVRMLYVRNAQTTWLKEYIPSFVNLEHLRLDQLDESYKEDSLVIGSACTRLFLTFFPCRVSLHWSKLEILHLDCFPINICLGMLEKCTQLIEFRLRTPFEQIEDEIEDDSSLPIAPFVLPRLKLFEWMTGGDYHLERAMLENIRMPALRTLVWGEENIDVEPSDSNSIFSEHLPSTLSVLQLQGIMVDSNISIFPYFSKLSSIESLNFKGCTGVFMDGVLSTLGSETCWVGNQEVPIFPNLKSIHIDQLDAGIDQANILQTFRRTYSQPASESLFVRATVTVMSQVTPELKNYRGK
ncbi:hypothetical protein AGABI2DRAFT_123019 [Agaricus bisporus var. bisporus H97]|uniref:hypothetical protein n=1 Tax=Agaricus bisporus var. bisporus (strain H97 / ATCC MYA-4626 / FGSC 10389) TaxID=936046 RepID=UPI00029F54FB|nr:hypothetical protein AGABI2DRAFT_123019 [Agaricus bisporus var. bisporus H97]EKV42298.1 hypothetical protein AGABI2DRAFT_123019 [Agaricus bisporus var. bisporus H97]